MIGSNLSPFISGSIMLSTASPCLFPIRLDHARSLLRRPSVTARIRSAIPAGSLKLPIDHSTFALRSPWTLLPILSVWPPPDDRSPSSFPILDVMDKEHHRGVCSIIDAIGCPTMCCYPNELQWQIRRCQCHGIPSTMATHRGCKQVHENHSGGSEQKGTGRRSGVVLASTGDRSLRVLRSSALPMEVKQNDL
jgi:hypothetical protein